jgi:hypothetical protein
VAPTDASGSSTPATPGQTVGGTRQRSATASLAVPRRCASGRVTVRVRGRLVRRVTFLVNGRRVRTVNVPSGRRSISASLPIRRFGAQRQRIQARVTFRNGAAPRTLNATANRCAQGEVSPQFTG